MKIEKIIYHTTRELNTVQEKLDITTVVLFSYKYDDKVFADLLYSKDKEKFVRRLEKEVNLEGIKWDIDFTRKEVLNALLSTIEEIKKKYDDLGYYKALHEGDEFAKVAYEMHKIFNKVGNIPELVTNIKKETDK